ncbi:MULTISPECIES: tetratricopeptide repeat protein [unclassified Nostoc]|nr:tetratricopeptide repeat protein [Nostoc sp. JL23]
MYRHLKEYEKAIKCYQQSLVICKRLGNRMSEIQNIEHIGELFIELKQHSKALKYYQQALAVAKEQGYQNNEDKIIEIINEINSCLSD